MHFQSVLKDIVIVSWALFRVMIPTLIIVKVAQETGLVDWLNHIFNPITQLIGLQEELTIVLTTTILTNPYAGLMVLASIGFPEGFTISQASVLASFMLFTHAMPVELAISRQAGAKILFLALVRILTATLFCFLVHYVLVYFNLLQELANFTLLEFKPTSNLTGWVVEQIKGLIFVQIVIIVLLFLLEFLKMIGIERLIRFVMTPFLRVLGVSQNASTIIVVGLTIGLGFGGGLMIKDVQAGNVEGKDAVNALIFINLFHSLIEDTSLVMLLGPNLVIILFLRAIFVLFIVYLLINLLKITPDWIFKKFVLNEKALGLKSQNT